MQKGNYRLRLNYYRVIPAGGSYSILIRCLFRLFRTCNLLVKIGQVENLEIKVVSNCRVSFYRFFKKWLKYSPEPEGRKFFAIFIEKGPKMVILADFGPFPTIPFDYHLIFKIFSNLSTFQLETGEFIILWNVKWKKFCCE